MRLDIVETTQRLVRIPSVNPMGRDLSGPEFLEHRLTDELERIVDRWGVDYERHHVLDGRDNLIAKIPGRGAGADLWGLLEVHQDTVPVDGMTIPPFDAVLEQGRIWGRGACDVKGGMAAMLCTAEQLLNSPATDQPTIFLAFTINEENGFDGVRALCESWQRGDSKLLTRAPDFAIVAEPSELKVIVAHKGSVRWRCHTTGRAAHSSDPSAGINAIYRMAEVVTAINSYTSGPLQQIPAHTDLGAATLSVGTIQGGISVNTVPDETVIEIDRRLLPGESPDTALESVRQYIAERCKFEVIHDEPFIAAPAMAAEHNQVLADELSRILQRGELSAGDQLGVPFGTNAATLSANGVPTVVFGPGSIDQAHTKNEWISINSLRAAEQALLAFCRRPAQEFTCDQSFGR